MSEKIKLGTLRKGAMINNWKVLKSTLKTITIWLPETRVKLTYKWDGEGYKRQGQYLYTDGIR